MKSGYGKKTWNDGSVYEGEWEMMHNKDKDNSLVLIKESTLEVGEIINYMVTENLHGPMEKSSQVNMNLI